MTFLHVHMYIANIFDKKISQFDIVFANSPSPSSSNVITAYLKNV